MTMNRLIARFAMLCIAIILGFFAVVHAQKGMQQQAAIDGAGLAPAEPGFPTQSMQPIPDAQSQPLPLTPQAEVAQAAAPLPEPDFGPPPPQQLPPASPAVAGPPVVDYQPELPPDLPPRLKPRTSEVPPPAANEQYDPGYGVVSARPLEDVPADTDGYYGNANDYQTVSNETVADQASNFEISSEPPAAAAGFQPPAASLPPIEQLPAEPQMAAPAAPPSYEYEPEPAASFAADPQPEFDTGSYHGSAHIGISSGSSPPGPLASGSSSTPSAAASAPGMRGGGRPGPADMEGVQTPTLTVAKSAPQETQVGQPARFKVTVRNVGSIPASDLIVRDEVPQGTSLIQTDPPSHQSPAGAVEWQLGTLEPGREVTVMMEVMPHEEGEIGSVATVAFQTSASARTMTTRPQLVLEHDGPRQILVGEDVVFNIKISNPGSGIAYNVMLAEDVPEGLRHYDGRELEFRVGNLQPGETRLLELKLRADKPGPVVNLLNASADAGLLVSDEYQFEVVAPLLQVSVNGPRRRYLERQAAFEITVANPGTAPAQDVQLVAKLPRGLRFMNTNNAGQYDSSSHSVRWSLAELPAKEMGTVELAAMPIKMGDHRIQVESSADMGLSSRTEHGLQVEGLAALLFTVTDVSDPIEVGGQTTYEIHVVNQGSKPATNLRLGALIPAGMEPVSGEGPARVNIEGNRVLFEPLARLAPQADTFYKVHVRGTSPGDKRVQVRLVSDEVSEPVTKEESTHVYADQ